MNFNFILTGLFIVSAQLVARVLLLQSTKCDIDFDYKCYIMVALYDLMMILTDVILYIMYTCKCFIKALDQTMYVIYRELENENQNENQNEETSEDNDETNEEINEETSDEFSESSENIQDELSQMSDKLDKLENLISSMVIEEEKNHEINNENRNEVTNDDVNRVINDLEKSVTEICNETKE